MSEELNSKMNHRMLMRIGDVPLRNANSINITSDDYNETGGTYTLNYTANHIINDDVTVGLKFTNGVLDYGESTTNIGGVTPSEPTGTDGYKVQYFDYDGTILKTEYVLTGGTSTPPTTPTHEYLTFSSWNNDNVNITRDTDIGAIYDTTDGKTYCFITMTIASGYQPTIYLNKTGSTNITVDWGDGEISTNNSVGEFSIQKPTPYISGSTGLLNKIITIQCGDFYGLGNPSLSQSVFYDQLNLLFNKCYLGNKINVIDDYAFKYCDTLQYISISNSIIFIGVGAFNYCSSIKSILIPTTITTIENSCLLFCDSITTIVLPNTITIIKNISISYNSSLKSIIIPNSVITIEDAAFDTCISLNSMVLPDTINTIPSSMFNGCQSLSSITLSNLITTIGDYSFMSCSRLQSIIIPNSVTHIGDSVFNGCKTLSSINIPNSVTHIGGYVFYDCVLLTSVIMNSIIPPTMGGGVFDNATKLIIYVPDSSLVAYKTASNWSSYADRIYPISTKI